MNAGFHAAMMNGNVTLKVRHDSLIVPPTGPHSATIAMEIYVLIDNQPQGPYTPEVIRQYLSSGQLRPDTMAAYAGSSDWKPLSTLLPSWDTQTAGKGTRFVPGMAPVQPKARSKRKLGLPITLGVVVLLLAAGGFFYWKFFGNSGPQVKVVTPAPTGVPNTLAELNTWYVEPPSGQNAATFFGQGFDALQITDADRASKDLPIIGAGQWPELGNPLPVKTKFAIAGLAQRNRAAWQAFEQATKFEQARYPIDLSQGSATLLPHLPKVKQGVELASLITTLLAANKQARPTTDALLTSLACAQSLKSEPIIISQIARMGDIAIITTNFEQVVNSVALPASDLERLAAAFGKAEADDDAGTPFARGCAGERALSLTTFDLPTDKIAEIVRNSAGGAAPSSESGRIGQTLAIKHLMRNWKSQRAFTEETFNRSLVLRKEPFPDRLKVDEFFTSRVDEAKTNEFQFCLLLMPALAKTAVREAGGLARFRLIQTAIALEQFRIKNANNYPATLDQLAPTFLPAAPQDPFNGQPLHYNQDGDGYELKSVGADSSNPITFKMVKPPGHPSASLTPAE